MIFFNEEETSCWAFEECFRGNDTPEIRNLITDPFWAYWYCYKINDIEEMWSKVDDSFWANQYCFFVNNRSEVRKYVKKTKRLNHATI